MLFRILNEFSIKIIQLYKQ
uniref:Uncharacterized protein n=1 Tax=Anguilla anguilla TaxID=7936 RepID=A0A0E9Q8F7_ANGAN